MKKNILLLINGFGIEQKDSYNVYKKELMPNLDRLTKDGFFSSLTSNYLDYKDAYRDFSIGIKMPLSYSIISNNIYNETYKNNQVLQYAIQQTNNNKSKLHIICYWDNSTTIEHLSVYLKYILTYINTKVCLHLVLTQKSLNDYKIMLPYFNTLNYEVSSKVKIGLITGENNINNLSTLRDYIRSFVTVVGEKWKDIEKRFNTCVSTRTTPNNMRTFMLNSDFALENNDQILFFNYSNVNVDQFIDEINIQKYKALDINSIGYYSLFPVKSHKKIPFMNNFAVSSTYALNSLKSINSKCLILDKKSRCPFINYYFTGLRNIIDPDLKYYATDDDFIYDKDKLLAFLKDKEQELIIINYDISDCKLVDDIEEKLRKIDIIIGILDTYIKEISGALIISSLYGIEKELYNKKQELCKINFSVRVPIIVDDISYSKNNYSLSEGSIYDLSNTVFKNINNKYKGNSLIKRKSSLLSIFYKKGGK